ncbi:MAG TPA: MBL fold metallo-hydrolase [Thermoleophilaceae bacterium]
MELFERVHLVASGSGGFDLTDPFDSHAYLVNGGSEAALVDAGIGAAVDQLLANVERAGVARDAVSSLLLTHAHPDHCGGAAALKEVLPQLEVLASPHVADAVERADEAAMSLAAGKTAGFYPVDYSPRRCAIATRLGDGDQIRVGSVSLRALATPGHSAGHLAYLGELGGRTACFCGDLVFYGGLISLENNLDCSLHDYAASVQRLEREWIDALLPGHHQISAWRGHRHVETAARQFARGFVPRSVV